jgi:hypothetical protein|tara:strand:- start:18768 stop:19019 length:252 start_codon:yes stop_codon:yes gene_type:complete
LIFSLLNVRKKTAASIAGIFIGLACLWGVSIWQDISPQEMVNILIGTVIMLAVIIGGALLLIIIFKLLCGLLRRLGASKENDA